MSNQVFSFYTIQPNNVNNQIDFNQILCFNPLIQTKMEWINKQLLVDVRWANKAI